MAASTFAESGSRDHRDLFFFEESIRELDVVHPRRTHGRERVERARRLERRQAYVAQARDNDLPAGAWVGIAVALAVALLLLVGSLAYILPKPPRH